MSDDFVPPHSGIRISLREKAIIDLSSPYLSVRRQAKAWLAAHKLYKSAGRKGNKHYARKRYLYRKESYTDYWNNERDHTNRRRRAFQRKLRVYRGIESELTNEQYSWLIAEANRLAKEYASDCGRPNKRSQFAIDRPDETKPLSVANVSVRLFFLGKSTGPSFDTRFVTLSNMWRPQHNRGSLTPDKTTQESV